MPYLDDWNQATEIASTSFERGFAMLPLAVRTVVIRKVRDLGSRLESYPHQRLTGQSTFRARIGDYRVIYRFNISNNTLFLLTVGNRREVYRE